MRKEEDKVSVGHGDLLLPTTIKWRLFVRFKEKNKTVVVEWL